MKLIMFCLLTFFSYISAIIICEVENDMIYGYPKDQSYSRNEYSYYISFNKTIMQANYVKYISTSGGNSCEKCNFRVDPYGINYLRRI